MSVKSENAAGGESVVLERPAAGGVYASLFEKINLNPVSELSALDIWQDAQAMSDASADERLTAGMQVFLECLTKSGSKVEKLDKNLIDHHIAELDYQISRQLDAVMHSEEFQAVESLWCGVKSLVDKTDFRQNVKIELLDMSKEDLRQDFEDSPEIIQSGLYKHTYIDEYDTPGGEPIAALISAYEFDASAQDVALLRNISKVSAAAHMPFIGSAGTKFFLKDSMEEVAAIKDEASEAAVYRDHNPSVRPDKNMSVKSRFLEKLQTRQSATASSVSKTQADIAEFRLRMGQLQEQMDTWLGGSD